MIRTVADFLLQLKQKEAARLATIELDHGPTIGDMYEGLSKDLLQRAIPQELGLQLVNGFVVDGQGNSSGQIDCMLVRGSGEQLPYTNAYRWHVKDVVAVFEIKKNLYGDDLADAFDHLRIVHDLERNYVETWHGSELVDVRMAHKTFAQMTGIVAPAADAADKLGIRDQLILATLRSEQISAVRIVLGYDGFKTEGGFRRSLLSHLERHLGVRGYGVGSFPQLIIAGGYSLLKANGLPFVTKLLDGKWPFYLSSSVNPLWLMLEYVWTRLARDYSIGGLWGDDLVIEPLNPFLLGTVLEQKGQIGWTYDYVDIKSSDLARNSNSKLWQPIYLSLEQFVVIQILCGGKRVRLDDVELIKYLESSSVLRDEFIQALLETKLVALDGCNIELITENCQCAILPDGNLVAAENNTGQLTRWIAAHRTASR